MFLFDGVTFAYDGAHKPALDAVSFAIGEHQRVALVGPSGAGKTTIISLLLRFFDPQQGAIRIGGVDVRDRRVSPTSARRLPSWRSDTYLFHGSIADNLRMAKPPTRAMSRSRPRRARGADRRLHPRPAPDGYATAVGERGAQLSGGQRQRVAIARALLKNAPILILDEATSSVDPASEAAIQMALERLFHKRTTIVIAHRLSTIRQADRISSSSTKARWWSAARHDESW